MDNRELARQWVAGLRTGEPSLLAPLIAVTAKVWHSTDGVTLDIATSAARLAARQPTGARATFENLRWQLCDHGFLVQGTIHGLEGWPEPTHIVQVLRVTNSVVTQIEEYVAVQGAIAAPPSTHEEDRCQTVP